MSSYATNGLKRPPKTMTLEEQVAIRRASGQHKSTFRDHVLLSIALGTALRIHEIVALNIGDVRDVNGAIRRRFALRVFKRSNKNEEDQEAILPDAIRFKLEKFMRWKKSESEALDDDAPLFISSRGTRLSKRQARTTFAKWQKLAGFERHVTFHSMRHTALSNLYRTSNNIRLVQKVARHASIESTTIYTHVSDEDVLRAVKDLPC